MSDDPEVPNVGLTDRPPRKIPIPEPKTSHGPAKVIAMRLGLAEMTVRNHIRAILAALDAHSQLEAIAKARRLELIT